MTMEMDLLLTPIPGENPAGEDLRYTQVYDDIKEARRADDPFAMGEWQRELKISDWDRVISVSLGALERQSKDLQIAAWLTEAMTATLGFKGLASGIGLICGLLRDFWDSVHPEAEEGDLEYRIAPIEFLNDKLSEAVRQVQLTDHDTNHGYSWLKWQESREVGYDADARNKYGDYDDQKQKRRSELMDDGKISAEAFDAAAARTSPAFFEALMDDLLLALERFMELDAMVDERFGSAAPRLSDLGKALDDCYRLVARFAPGKKRREPEELRVPAAVRKAQSLSKEEAAVATPEPSDSMKHELAANDQLPASQPANDPLSGEERLWEEAVATMENGGFREALDNLLSIANSQPSDRGRNRCRLLVAKLCLLAGRHELARPIMEQLSALIDEHKLERWESPLWIAEVLEALYQCLTAGEPSEEEKARAEGLFTRICTMDVTKALIYRKQ
ncbi:MAG TPA: type VI secretion system protein TssA [Geobacteraceae bacterium]